MELWINGNTRIDAYVTNLELEESIDSIAYTLNVELVLKDDIESKLKKGMQISVYDYHYATKAYWMLFNGTIRNYVINYKSKSISITGKERTICLEESEDELLLLEGETASQRIMNIASEWSIPIGVIEDTAVPLAKDLRKESLFSSIKKDLLETAQKGGSLFRVRLTEKLELFEIGSNLILYELSAALEDREDSYSLEGAVTQVKVLGKSEDEENLSPVIGVFSQNTANYGTIQKLSQDEKITDYSSAETKANTMFSAGEDSIKVTVAEDINVLRAGNKIALNNNILYVTDIKHTSGGKGKMNLTLMNLEGVRAKFYGNQQ